jgi:hypothetical protein
MVRSVGRRRLLTEFREALLVLRPQPVHDEGVRPRAALLLRRRAALAGGLAERRRPRERQHVEVELSGLILAPILPDEVEEAFVQANPGLTRDGIAVTCSSRRLGEVRICLGRDLRFRACPEIDARACRRDELVMPPVRGGSAALTR